MEIRQTTGNDFESFVDTVHTAFGRSREATPAGGNWWSALEIERGLFALDTGGRPIGTAAATPSNSPSPATSSRPPPGSPPSGCCRHTGAAACSPR